MFWAVLADAGSGGGVHPIVQNLAALLGAGGGVAAVLVAVIARNSKASTSSTAPAPPQGQAPATPEAPKEVTDYTGEFIRDLQRQNAALREENEAHEETIKRQERLIRRLRGESG